MADITTSRNKKWTYYVVFTLVYFCVDFIGIVAAIVGWKVFDFNPMNLWGMNFLIAFCISIPQVLFGILPAFFYNRYGFRWQLVLPSVALLVVNILVYICFGEGNSGLLLLAGGIPTLSACGPSSIFLASSIVHRFNIPFPFYLVLTLLATPTYLFITYAAALIISSYSRPKNKPNTP